MHTFIELFAGGGLVREGLGQGWDCLYANDACPEKAETYRDNHGDAELVVKDVREVTAQELPHADLVTAGFPCQDHSVAGPKAGFAEGERGLLVFTVVSLLARLAALKKAPRLILLENVLGLLEAAGGRDFVAVLTALASADYTLGVMAVDALRFVPQSRRRLFIAAVAPGTPIPAGMASRRPRGPWYPKRLVDALDAMPAAVLSKLVWWKLPVPPARATCLADLVEPFGSPDERWRSAENVAALVATCRGADGARLAHARAAGRPVYGTCGYRRWDRAKEHGRALAVRFDGTAECLVRKADLHHQVLIRVDGDDIRIRNFTPRELARLTGLRDGYRMPRSVSRSARLAGDGVAVPAVRWLAGHLLEPLLAAKADERDAAPARRRPERARKDVPAAGDGPLKAWTVGTTVYLLPEQSERLHGLARRMGITLHELTMRGYDRLLMEHGLPPVVRPPARRRRARADEPGEGDISPVRPRVRFAPSRRRFRPRTVRPHRAAQAARL